MGLETTLLKLLSSSQAFGAGGSSHPVIFGFLRYLICSKLTHCRISSVSFEKCIQCYIIVPAQSRYRTVPSFVKVPLYLFVVNHFLQIKSLPPLDLFLSLQIFFNLQKVSVVCSFLLMSTIPLQRCTTFCLSSHPLKDIQIVFSLG